MLAVEVVVANPMISPQQVLNALIVNLIQVQRKKSPRILVRLHAALTKYIISIGYYIIYIKLCD